MINAQALGGTFTFPGTSLTVHRLGYGAMQLAGPGVFGPPKDPEAAVAVLREAVAAGVNHIDTSDFYGPHVTNELIKKALHPYSKDLVLVTKVGFLRGEDKSWFPASKPAELVAAVHSNLKESRPRSARDRQHPLRLRARPERRVDRGARSVPSSI